MAEDQPTVTVAPDTATVEDASKKLGDASKAEDEIRAIGEMLARHRSDLQELDCLSATFKLFSKNPPQLHFVEPAQILVRFRAETVLANHLFYRVSCFSFE